MTLGRFPRICLFAATFVSISSSTSIPSPGASGTRERPLADRNALCRDVLFVLVVEIDRVAAGARKKPPPGCSVIAFINVPPVSCKITCAFAFDASMPRVMMSATECPIM